jgi:hypothetical protein
MYSNTRFRKTLSGLPRGIFDRLVVELQAESTPLLQTISQTRNG